MSKLEEIKRKWSGVEAWEITEDPTATEAGLSKKVLHQRGFPLAYFPPYPPTKETACIVSSHSDVHYLLSIIEQAEKALKYYATLYDNIESNIQVGELITDWLKRQGETANQALKVIRGEE
jgi:hypothetical protein